MIRHRILPLLFAAAVASAQQPTEPANPTRLDQMEAIYQKELSARHIPLLGKYLTELQRLGAMATADEQPSYQAEIGRIQAVISAGGALDLIAAQKSPTGELPMPAPMPPPDPAERKNALIVLTPALAARTAPPLEAGAVSPAVIAAEWRIESMEAGTYDILIHYSAPALAEPLPVKVEFAGQTVQKVMDTTRVTKDAESFRIFRLGTLALTADQRGETLRLTVGDQKQPLLQLKSVLITKPRPPSN
jgi:hypothetical protein